MAEIPTVIGRYQIARELAHGGMGSLYLARDPAIDRLVAIKLLREGFEDESVRERFAREVRATGKLHHPNIVTVFDTGEHGDRPFIAMEYVAGETLASVIHRRAPASIIEKLTILEEVCDGLLCAHEAGIIHRDIKPANVMIDDATGAVKILDFGIAHAGETGLTNAGEMVGTLNYMAPEQISGAMVDQRTDIYAVGVLAYELLSYQRAFAGTMHEGVLGRLLHGPPPAIESVVPGIDPQLSTVVARAMAKQPSDRYEGMEQLRQELEAVRTRLFDSGVDNVEPLGVPVDADADAETVAGQDVATPLRPRSRRGTGTGRRTGSGVGSRASTPGKAAPSTPLGAGPVRHRRVVAASAMAVSVLLTVTSILYWQRTRSAVTIESPRPAVETMPPPPPQTAPADKALERPRADEQRLAALRTTARRQVTAGRPHEALDTISAGLVLDSSDAELRALVDDLARAARQSVNASRAATAKIGVTEATSADLRDARRLEREADALERSGNHAAAIRALWMAAARYEGTVKAASARSVPPETPAPATAATQAGATGAPQPERVQSPAVIPLVPGTLPPGPELPPPTPPPQPAKPAAPAVDARGADMAAIRDLLRRYVEAYRTRDISAVAKVMPSLTQQQLRALERDFANFRSYHVEIADERIAVEGSTATVTCRVVRSFVSRTGTGGGNTVPSLFHLRKSGEAWVIESLQSR